MLIYTITIYLKLIKYNYLKLYLKEWTSTIIVNY